MKPTPIELNELGLTGQLRSLMQYLLSRRDLDEKLAQATAAVNANREAIHNLESDLGAQARLKGRQLVVLAEGFAAVVPLPPVGYEETHVRIEISKPIGFLPT